MITTGKNFTCLVFLHACAFFLFIISLLVITSFYFTCIPDKFNEFKIILKQENSNNKCTRQTVNTANSHHFSIHVSVSLVTTSSIMLTMPRVKLFSNIFNNRTENCSVGQAVVKLPRPHFLSHLLILVLFLL